MAVSPYSQRTSLSDQRDFWIYRIWSADENKRPKTLLYVGQSTNLKARIRTHHTRGIWSKSYFLDAATCCVYQEMCVEEKIQIYTMQPTLNKRCKVMTVGQYEGLISFRSKMTEEFPDYTVVVPILNWFEVGSIEWNAHIEDMTRLQGSMK